MDKQDLEKIEQYILDEMNDADRNLFEQRLTTEEKLAEKLRLELETFSFIDAIGDQKMKTKFDQIHGEVIEKNTKSNAALKKAISFFVLLLLLAGMCYYFFMHQKTAPAPDVIYASYYTDYPLNLASRGEPTSLELQQVNALYKTQQYKEVLPLLEKLINQSADSQLQIAAGISALQSEAYDKALFHFNNLIDNKDSLYEGQAKWYAAMTALKLEDLSLAKRYLQSIVDANASFKKKESHTILKSLE